jgi:hypothetical protein
MSITLSVNKKTKKPVIKFNPALTQKNANDMMQVFLDTIPQLMMDLVANLYPMLRPATEAERDAHIYVFMDGERGEMENKVFRAKKHCYDILMQMFSTTLTALFPDVEYINSCAEYQQNFTAEHTELEVKEYLKDVESLTESIRTNMDKIIKEMLEEVQNDTMDKESDNEAEKSEEV